ncbi:MAG: DNA internalization-related competence protein ComEC/Rec2 [Nitrospirales bacterium]|nr:DNA internalization-related competence protein ComEC/Rec2 [Nitrospirales bacterium]MDR4481930.1 DNA internalization-related competence protein ComEC/Rec2 [Nitrospirales bacterium]
MILLGVVSYLTGLWFGPFLPLFPLSLLGALFIFGCLLTWFEQQRRLTRQTGIILFAVAVAGIGHAYWASTAQWDSTLVDDAGEQPVFLEGTIVAPVRQTPDGLVLLVEATRMVKQGEEQVAHGRIRLTWREPGEYRLIYGDHIDFMVRIREPYGTMNPGGFHYGRYLKGKGIHAVATVQGPEAVRVQDNKERTIPDFLLGMVDRWRQTIHHAAVSSLTNPALGLFLGMVLGEQSYIESDIRDAFMASGTVHILSISGSHLGLLALLIFVGARWSLRQLPTIWLERLSLRVTATRFAVLITLPAVSFYTLLAGAEMATVRSWIMIVVCCIGIWLGRERNLVTALAVAALLMVLPHPEAIQDISFQLSYLSVAAIALLVLDRKEKDSNLSGLNAVFPPAKPPWLLGLWHKAVLAWLITLAVSLTTLPLVAHDFHQIPWLGLLANMVIVPLVGAIMIPLGLLSGMIVLVRGGVTLPLSSVNQGVFDWLAQGVMMLSHVPGAAWYVASPSMSSMIVFWGMLAVGVAMWHRQLIRWGCGSILLAILLWWGWSPRTGWSPGTVRVTFLDVGQGDATLIELPDGQTVLIDGGPSYRRLDMGRAVIGPYLWNQGIRRLDHVVATHPQWDHVGGLPWVLDTFEVGHYWDNGISRPERFFSRLHLAVKSAGLQEQTPTAGTVIVRGPCSLTVLSPSHSQGKQGFGSWTVSSGKDLNNRSLVTRLECGTHSFLFTADVEQQSLDELLQVSSGLSARIVKVPHHGAKSSLHREWVNRLQAEAMVVSVGAHNRYGHPAPEVLDAYKQRGLPVYRTDRDGAVWFTATLGADDMTVRTAREGSLLQVQPGLRMWREEWANWTRIWNR